MQFKILNTFVFLIMKQHTNSGGGTGIVLAKCVNFSGKQLLFYKNILYYLSVLIKNVFGHYHYVSSSKHAKGKRHLT